MGGPLTGRRNGVDIAGGWKTVSNGETLAGKFKINKMHFLFPLLSLTKSVTFASKNKKRDKEERDDSTTIFRSLSLGFKLD